MAILAGRRSEDFFGLRPLDPMKDLRGVADLIEEAFAHDLDRSGQNALQELRWLSRLKPILWWMLYANPGHTDFLSGFVWEEERKIVGNITVNRTGAGSRRWLISNLAVARRWRSRGIARGLMQSGLELVREYNGLSVALQVRTDNAPAKHLYDSFGFKEISGKTQLWARRVPKVDYYPLPRRLLLRPRKFDIDDARQAFNLAMVATPQLAQKEWPLRQNQFRLSSSERVNNYFRWLVGGGAALFWVVEDGQRIVATINIRPGVWGQSHKLDLVVHPDWRGNLEKPLISRALKYLYTWRGRGLSIKQAADHRAAVEAYKEFGLKEIQTLVWMKKKM
jgi:ribosomal protein S18 acetylase RimI-like enzyme